VQCKVVRSNKSLDRTRERSSAKLTHRRARRSAQPLGVMIQSRVHIWLLLGIATVSLGNGVSQSDGESDSLSHERGFVFAGASARLLAKGHFPENAIGKSWDPTSDQISELEETLTRDLRARLIEKRQPDSDGPRVHDYFRQYAGVHLNGKKLIFINGFHKSHVQDTVQWLSDPRPESALTAFPKEARNEVFWHFVPVHVMDGGEYYFQAYYDPASRRLLWFRFQGYA